MTDALHRAVAALQAGDLSRAEREFRAVLKDEPENPAALINLGVVLRQQGRLSDAIATFERAAAADPGNFRAFANLGVALQQARRLEDAVAAYRAAYRLEPRAVRQIAVNLSAPGTGMLFLDPRRLEDFLGTD